MELYDFHYKRYENIDVIVDHKGQYEFNDFVSGKLKLLVNFRGGMLSGTDMIAFRDHYSEFREICRKHFIITGAAKWNLDQIQLLVDKLLEDLRNELNS